MTEAGPSIIPMAPNGHREHCSSGAGRHYGLEFPAMVQVRDTTGAHDRTNHRPPYDAE